MSDTREIAIKRNDIESLRQTYQSHYGLDMAANGIMNLCAEIDVMRWAIIERRFRIIDEGEHTAVESLMELYRMVSRNEPKETPKPL